ncbi:TPA: GNAT family N-acetyltransferase, partial [bacterium]|nr:GNAT family N-acetyltransferase [bacterium]
MFFRPSFTILAKDGKKLIGVLQWIIKEDVGTGVVEIEEVLVLEDYRGKGIGAKLVEYCIK